MLSQSSVLGALAATLLMQDASFRPPAVPLVTHDPYLSVWSFTDHLADDWTKHWTGKNHALTGMVRVDGSTYRWMSLGLEELPKAEQRKREVLPSKTHYLFRAGGVELAVDFHAAADIRDADQLSRSDTRIAFSLESVDGKRHEVQIYLDCSPELVVNETQQAVSWSRMNQGGRTLLAIWHEGGAPLNRVGDDHRIDWGKLFFLGEGGFARIAESRECRKDFAANGALLGDDETRFPRPARDGWPVLAWSSNELEVEPDKALLDATAVTLAYDDVASIEYFGRPLQAAWRSSEPNRSWPENPSQGSQDIDAFADEWREIGGAGYAQLCALAYRQCLAAHKIVRDIDGTLLMFSKENFSNGCIGTVDVMYPACPIFLAYNPALLKANMEPVMQYASMPRWPWPFAPHDLGTYPKANGQVYGGGERSEEDQMPVEESGNMLIMAAAYLDRSGDKAWIEKYWPLWTKWAEYLRQYGLDPGEQLCTDDFAGHLAHNANLSVKAIVAMACYGRLCGATGRAAEAEEWAAVAKELAARWAEMAEDGGHTRLAFDRPGTWSQKYNLVWDKVLDLGLFSKETYAKEVAWYMVRQNAFGLPLDNRADYTKLDWTVWTACLAEEQRDFDALVAPLVKWMNETPDRLPLTDWFDTKTGKCVGFRARSVVGGVFMPLLLKKAGRAPFK
ncbi:MAG: DUF4965 domain-containing protein [Fimbriimonadaceae bacterium]|nr:DUF4965 domain-containing protein [Fimbriimonadaceae bacterium]QYK55733.1 MAG: DUF4965 domain-containing protein [Fimbriimonadaceae bacterium]